MYDLKYEDIRKIIDMFYVHSDDIKFKDSCYSNIEYYCEVHDRRSKKDI